MTSHVGRLYAAVAAVLAFFVLWAAIAAHPWQPKAAADPRLAALAQREQLLRREAVLVRQVVARRAAVAQAAKARVAAAAAAPAAPSVRVVTLPPLTITRTS